MLNSNYRLQKNEDFQTVFQRGTSTANRQFVIYKLDKEEQDIVRVGISVSKKLGNAVTRNRIKRHIREAIRVHLPQITWKGDVIIIARLPLLEMDYHEMVDSLAHCLVKAKLLSKRKDL
jgi:ribonuclease P protein component